MKTFKQFCEGYKKPNLEKMDHKVKKLQGEFSAELKNPNAPGFLGRASRLVTRVGNISAAASGSTRSKDT